MGVLWLIVREVNENGEKENVKFRLLRSDSMDLVTRFFAYRALQSLDVTRAADILEVLGRE